MIRAPQGSMSEVGYQYSAKSQEQFLRNVMRTTWHANFVPLYVCRYRVQASRSARQYQEKSCARIETRQRKIQVSQIPYLIYFLKSLVSVDTIPHRWEFTLPVF